MANANAAPRSVSSALEEVTHWKSETAQKSKNELGEVDQEVENLRTAINNLQQQIEALQRSREEIATRSDSLNEEEISRSYNAVFAALLDQAESVRIRAAEIAEGDAARARKLMEALKDPAIASKMTEYTQFKTTVEPTLAALPESYRGVILQHHEGLAKQLKDLLGNIGGTPASYEGPGIAVDVVFAVDAPEGTPEVLMLVLPVQEQVHADWATRQEDAQTWLAARVVQAVYAACTSAGLANSRAAFGGHQGLLAVEVELGGARGDVGQMVTDELIRAFVGSAELRDAKIEVRPRQLVVDHLLPPEDAEAENA